MSHASLKSARRQSGQYLYREDRERARAQGAVRGNTMASTKVALLLLGAFALAAVASADNVQNGGKMTQGQYWESKGWEKVDKELIHDEPKPPKELKDKVDKPPKIVIDKLPPMFAPPQQPAKPRFHKPKFEIVKASPSPKPEKVKIIKEKEPKIHDNTEPFKNKEKFPYPEFNKVFASPSPKPEKVKIIKDKEPKIIDNTEPFHNKEEYPKPDFRKVYSPAPPKVKIIKPKIVEAPIKDITKAPPKVTKGFIDPPGKNIVKDPKGP